MIRSITSRTGSRLALGLLLAFGAEANAGWPFARPRRSESPLPVYPTSNAVIVDPPRIVATSANATAPTPMLGTFYPTPYMSVRGNAPTGGGYSPLGTYGDQNLVLYGPLSSLRASSAPVLTYVRGYDGVVYPTQGTAISYPNLPPASRVVYPTRGSSFYGFRESGTPPWWSNAANWIDQN
jgi:hypothetical protein